MNDNINNGVSMKIQQVDVDKILHYDKNTKKHPDDQIKKIAAEQLNRRCYIMEFEPIYCQVIINRWQKLTGKTAEKIV